MCDDRQPIKTNGLGEIRFEKDWQRNDMMITWHFNYEELIESTTTTLMYLISEKMAEYLAKEIFLKDKKLAKKLKKKMLKAIYNSKDKIVKNIINERIKQN